MKTNHFRGLVEDDDIRHVSFFYLMFNYGVTTSIYVSSFMIVPPPPALLSFSIFLSLLVAYINVCSMCINDAINDMRSGMKA